MADDVELHVLTGHLYIFSCKYLLESFAYFFNWVFSLWFVSSQLYRHFFPFNSTDEIIKYVLLYPDFPQNN